MLTFRRVSLVVFCILAVLFCFSDSEKKRKLDAIEARIKESKTLSESLINEYARVGDEQNRVLQQEIQRLDKERKLLELRLQEVRKLSDASSTVAEQLDFLVPYRVDQKFPAFIWQTWKNDLNDAKLNPEIRSYIQSWDTVNANFVHEVLNDRNAEKLVKHLYKNIPKVVQAYQAMPTPILKADFFRYLILFARGGVYTDADTEALKPVPNWFPNWLNADDAGLVVGVEADPDRPDWAQWYARRLQFCQWTIQAKPGHPVLRSIVANITETTLDRKARGELDLAPGSEEGADIMNWTGPGIWTDMLFEYFNSVAAEPVTYETFSKRETGTFVGDVLVLPITSFSPGVGHMGSKSVSDPMAFVQHHFSGSWKPEAERM